MQARHEERTSYYEVATILIDGAHHQIENDSCIRGVRKVSDLVFRIPRHVPPPPPLENRESRRKFGFRAPAAARTLNLRTSPVSCYLKSSRFDSMIARVTAQVSADFLAATARTIIATWNHLYRAPFLSALPHSLGVFFILFDLEWKNVEETGGQPGVSSNYV